VEELRKKGINSIFMHDNVKIHTAGRMLAWLEVNGIEFLEDWPAYSPDLNPIEHV
jgi:transposase